jgi:hypothetical protein
MIMTMALSIGPDVGNTYVYIIQMEVIAIAKSIVSPISVTAIVFLGFFI